MKWILSLAGMTILLLALLAFIGCGDNNDTIANNGSDNIAVAAVYPADGSTDVSSAASLAIKFTGPVDTFSVMHNMYLIGGQQMHQWRDSLDHYGGFGMMNMGMQAHMINWLDSIEVSGQFNWNTALDSCRFVPDSGLSLNNDYLCLYYEGGMMGRHGGMMGGADHGDSGYHMFGFTTAP